MKQLRRNTHTFDYPARSFWPSTNSPPGNLDQKPSRKETQKEQDDADEEARRKATKDLVGSWNDRLQLISLITTFMASVEAGLLQVSAPGSDDPSTALSVSNACLISALIIHLHASFMSFVGAFFLVRFKVKEAKRAEDKVEGETAGSNTQQPSKGSVILDMAAKHVTDSPETSSPTSSSGAFRPRANVWSANPQLVQVGPFFRQPPINLLSRCHFLCILCSGFGFALALAGIMCLVWAVHPTGVKIATTTVLGICIASGFAIVFSKHDTAHFLYEEEN